MLDPDVELLQAQVQDLQECNQALRDYVKRANFELRTYHEEYGILQALRDPRDSLDPMADQLDPRALPPLLVAYDNRIKCLEAELPQQLQLGIDRGAHDAQARLAQCEAETARLRQEAEGLKAQLAREAGQGLSLQTTYKDALCAMEAERARMKLAVEENQVLRDSQREMTGALDKLSDRIRAFDADAQTAERTKAVLENAVRSLQQREATLQHQLREAREDGERLRTEVGSLLQQAERERACLQGVQQQEAAGQANVKELVEEVEAARRENRRLQRELEAGRQSVQGLHQGEADLVRRLKEALEHVEECKVELSTGLAREGQKDAQLATLRDQLRQLLAAQTETHTKHLKVVAAKHRAHVEELKEELKAKDIEASGLRAQVEKCRWETAQKESLVVALQREGSAPAVGHMSGALEDGGDRTRQALVERDELQRRLEASVQRHKREARDWELQGDQLRAQLQERDRRLAQAEAALADLREEADQARQEADRVQRQCQAARREREEAECKAGLDLAACTARAALQEERLRVQAEEALAKLRIAEQALERGAEQRLERERQVRQEGQAERSRLAEAEAMARAEAADAERRNRELSTQLQRLQTAAREREREAEAAVGRSQQAAKSLEVHKEQLSRTTQKLALLIEREATTRRALQDCQLQLDREHLERDRVQRDRDRYRAELSEVRALLQDAAGAAHPHHHGVDFCDAGGPLGEVLMGTTAVLTRSKRHRRPTRAPSLSSDGVS